MNLWLRILLLLLATPFRPKLKPPFDVSRLTFRVWPNDLDTNLHMNNGRYLTVMDLGRLDLTLRMGLAGHARRNGWMPILSAANVLFRRELRPFQKYVLETRILWWSQTHFVMEHRMLVPAKSGESPHLAARALMHGGIYQRKAKRFVPVEEIMQIMGVEAESPEPGPDVEAALAAIRIKREVAAAQSRGERL
ncbi:MAG: thioesterase family protein [Beijerinckiaceae bacterium]